MKFRLSESEGVSMKLIPASVKLVLNVKQKCR